MQPIILFPSFAARMTLARFVALIMPSSLSVSERENQAVSADSSSRSAKVVERSEGRGRFHHIQLLFVWVGSFVNARFRVSVCQGEYGMREINSSGISRSRRTPIMKSRGRDCGTKREAFTTNAPTSYPACSTWLHMVAKSLPPCEVIAPQTFSKTITFGARPSFMRFLSLINISEPTRLGMISYAVFCL